MTVYKNDVTWRDFQDKDYIYVEGTPYPRKGKKASKERIEELLSNKNARKEPLISAVEGEKKKDKAPKAEAKPKEGDA